MVAFRSEDDWFARAEWSQVDRKALPETDAPGTVLAVRHWRTMDMSAPEFLIAVAIAVGISMATFRHADKHGSTHATAWGLGAFLAAGVVVPIYIVRFWLRKRRPSS